MQKNPTTINLFPLPLFPVRPAIRQLSILVVTSPLVSSPSLTTLSVKRLVMMGGGSVLLASRMPVSMASLVCSDSLKAFRKSNSYKTTDSTL